MESEDKLVKYLSRMTLTFHSIGLSTSPKSSVYLGSRKH